MGDLIEARKLTRFFDLGGNQRVHAVDKVSLTIGEREIVGLVGESGSGKSTFGKTLLGLHDKTDGEVIFRVRPCHKNTGRQTFKSWPPRCR